MIAVAKVRPSERAQFLQKTYMHLAGAIGAFILGEFFLFQTGIAEALTKFIFGGQFNWLMILAAFILLGWFSRGFAAKAGEVGVQYAGLGIYVIAQALIFAPLVFFAASITDPTAISTAAILALLMFAGLTAIAFTTKKDFTFLGGILKMGGFMALGLILCKVLFGCTLGLVFSGVMVAFASAAILYDTSKIIHHYSTDQYVAASLELFASIALLFWYLLQIVTDNLPW